MRMFPLGEPASEVSANEHLHTLLKLLQGKDLVASKDACLRQLAAIRKMRVHEAWLYDARPSCVSHRKGEVGNGRN